MSKSNLIDRYVFQVGNQLSGKERDDIQLELRSSLHDMLEERGLDAENPEHEDQIAEVLKEFGSPHVIANSYRANRYLIGPRYFPIYIQVVKIVAWIMIGLVTFGTLLGGLRGDGLIEQIGNLFGSYTSALFQSAAIVTLIFVALERSGVADEDIDAEYAKGWDPKKLPEIKDVDRIDHFEVIVELLFGLGFLVGLNAVFGFLGPPAEFIRNWPYAPDIIEEILPFVPFMVITFVIEVGRKSYVLLRGSWQQWTRWIEFGLSVADTVILALILAQAPFSDLVWLDITVKISVVIALLIVAGTGMAQLYRLIWPQRQLPWRRFGERLDRFA